jgi:hypothetical protein
MTIVKKYHKTPNHSGEEFEELNLHVDVKLVALPTQHLLNNRGFSSTLWKETPAGKMI